MCCSSSVVRPRPPTQLAEGRLQVTPASKAGSCSTSMWRPCEGREATLFFPSGPSGLVPGAGAEGRRRSPQNFGGANGPDCLFHNLCRVFSVRSEVCDVVDFSFEDLDVTVNVPL
jgi:hypothetical protein